MHRYFPIWVDHVSSKLLGVDLRLTRLGEGGESAARAVHLAKAVVEDLGLGSLCFPPTCVNYPNHFLQDLFGWGIPKHKPWEEAGESSVHKVTASVAKIRERNLHRDLFRFIRLPLELVYVACPLLMQPWMNDRVHEAQLPMIDPHELLDYLHKSGRLKVDPY